MLADLALKPRTITMRSLELCVVLVVAAPKIVDIAVQKHSVEGRVFGRLIGEAIPSCYCSDSDLKDFSQALVLLPPKGFLVEPGFLCSFLGPLRGEAL